jgi:hypothetical protein
MKLEISAGQKFGYLTVVKELEKKILPSGQTNRNFLMKCVCGKEKEIRLLHFSKGRIESCGCISGHEKHGGGGTRLHNVWRSMKERCKTSYFQSKYYADKRITLYDGWRRFVVFKKWALANGFKDGLQLDRENNNKGYHPDNCRFITPKGNANNRDVTFFVTINNIRMPFTEALDKYGLQNHSDAIRTRVKRGWEAKEAFETPIKKGKYWTKAEGNHGRIKKQNSRLKN